MGFEAVRDCWPDVISKGRVHTWKAPLRCLWHQSPDWALGHTVLKCSGQQQTPVDSLYLFLWVINNLDVEHNVLTFAYLHVLSAKLRKTVDFQIFGYLTHFVTIWGLCILRIVLKHMAWLWWGLCKWVTAADPGLESRQCEHVWSIHWSSEGPHSAGFVLLIWPALLCATSLTVNVEVSSVNRQLFERKKKHIYGFLPCSRLACL